ncbi:RNA polymerase sigma factor [Propionibacteriaceae bacterium G57]|uniref:RNA polymerase sigma factor n=1 Tax=Aestuariimicrobium sp. G57 TaxID=3418485 RepID=UPI003DA71840
MPITADDRLLLARLTRPERSVPVDDDTLVVLLGRVQAGDDRAGEEVLAAMAFGLASMARTSVHSSLGAFVSAAWFVVSGFNLERRNQVLTNLLLDTLKHLTRDRVTRWDPTVLPHPDPAMWGPDINRHRPARDEAKQVLDQASSLRLIDAPTREVLDRVYLAGYSGRETAAQVGTSHDMVRYRCSRAIRMLREHRGELVAMGW